MAGRPGQRVTSFATIIPACPIIFNLMTKESYKIYQDAISRVINSEHPESRHVNEIIQKTLKEGVKPREKADF